MTCLHHKVLLEELDHALERSDFDHPFYYCPFCGEELK